MESILGCEDICYVARTIYQLPFTLATQELIAAVAGKQIQVVGLQLSSDAAARAVFTNGTEQIMGYCLAANGGLIRSVSSGIVLFATDAGKALNLTITGAITNGYGYLQYIVK
jgi:hypothetical protein